MAVLPAPPQRGARFLRKKFVGKKVKVAIDYTREPMGPGGSAPTGMMAAMGTMFFASVFERQSNLAAEVIAQRDRITVF